MDDAEFENELVTSLDRLNTIFDDQVHRSQQLCDQYLSTETEPPPEDESFETTLNNLRQAISNLNQQVDNGNFVDQGQPSANIGPQPQVWFEHRTCWRCGERGHLMRHCKVILHHTRRTYRQFTRPSATCNSSQSAPQDSTSKPELNGRSTVTPVLVQGVETQALLDTGATISTVSEVFHREHLWHLPIEPLKDFLNVECADGGSLPYLGYVEAEVHALGLQDDDAPPQPCLLLVVPGRLTSIAMSLCC